jgi:hypothetical protein
MKHNLKPLNYDSLPDGDAPASESDSIVYRYRDVPGIAQARRALGLSVANRLAAVADVLGSDVARRESFLIANCTAADNSWFGSFLHSENENTGLVELFDGVGVLAGCGSRLCPACSSDLRRRSRRRACAGLKAVEGVGGLRFVTLTQPTPQGASLIGVLKVFQDAWRRLNKKQFWIDRALGVVKGVEFTVNELGYHVHAHLIVAGGYIERDKAQQLKSIEWRQRRDAKAAKNNLKVIEKLPALGNLQDAWESCLRAAWAAADWFVIDTDADATLAAGAGGVFVDMRASNEGAGVGVDVRAVRSKKSKDFSDADISIADAIKEVLKYVTKSDSWLKLPDAHLVEVASIRRWSRMFEVLGVCRPAAPSKASVFNGAVAGSVSLDCAPSVPVVAQIDSISFDARLAALRADAFSKLGDADALALLRQVSEDRRAFPLLGVAPDLVAAVNFATAYLDTPVLSAEKRWDEVGTLSDPVAFARRRACSLHRSNSLRALGELMDFREWCVAVRVRITKKIKVRKALLARQFPHATFWTLAGDRWGVGQSSSGMALADN